jgi:hypothetical protein
VVWRRMPLHQLSVYMENKPKKMASVLADLENFKVYALSIAEAGDFGLIRLIVSEPEKAAEHLESRGHSLAKSKKNVEVTGLLITGEVELSSIAEKLGEMGINIDYAYSTSSPISGSLALILRTDNQKEAEETLAKSGVRILTNEDLS